MRFLGDRFWVTALVMFGLGLTVPGEWGWFKPVVPVCLGGILLFSALRFSLGELREDLSDGGRWGRMSGWTGVKLLVMPFLAWGVAMVVAPEWALGVFLVGALPAGYTSLAVTELHGGRRTAAMMCVGMGSMVAPLTVPLLLRCLPGSTHALTDFSWTAIAHESIYMLFLIAVPVALAQGIRSTAPRFVTWLLPYCGRAALACSCLLVFVSLVSHRETWGHFSYPELAVPLLVAVIPVGLGVILTLLSRRWLTRSEWIAWSSGAVYVNNGLGIAFVSRFYADDPKMLLPCLMLQVPMLLATAYVGRVFPVKSQESP